MAEKHAVRLLLGLALAAIAISVVECRRTSAPLTPTEPGASQALASQHVARARPASETCTIDGRVTDVGGTGLAGALVCANTWPPACAVSDTSGAYAIAGIVADDVSSAKIRAQRAGYLVQGMSFADSSTGRHRGVDIQMGPGGVLLSGVVRDFGGGPIARAFVATDDAITLSDDGGHYALWLPETFAAITATADGYTAAQQHVQPPGQLDFALLPEATLDGTAVDAATGRPMPQLRVAITSPTDVEPVVSDADGRFHFGKLEPGLYTLAVDDDHATAIHDSAVTVELGAHVDDVLVRTVPAFEVSGRVTIEPGGERCPNPVVVLSGDATPHYGQLDEPGVRVGGLRPGTYDVDVGCADHLSRPDYGKIVVADHDIADQVWTVSAGATIRGRVVNAHGEPLGDIAVYADEVAPAEVNRRSAGQSRTDGDGRFTIVGLKPVRHELSVTPPHGGQTSDATHAIVELALDHPAQHDFVIDDSAGVLNGRVVAQDGTPFANLSVAVTPVNGSSGGIGMQTDELGRFTTDGLLGDYRVTLAYDDVALPITGADATGTSVHISHGATREITLTTHRPDGVIRGRVIDDQGQPVDDAFVAVSKYDASWPDAAFGALVEVMVAPDGTFTAAHLPDAQFTVRAYRKPGGEVVTQPVATGANLTLQLLPAATITGLVHLGGAALDKFEVELRDSDSNWQNHRDELYGSRGRFALHGVTAGHHHLAITSPSGGKIVDLDLAPGQTKDLDVEIDPMATVTGRVVEQDTGEPVAGVEVIPNLGYCKTATTDASGRFRVEVAARGEIAFSIMAPDDVIHTSWSSRTYKTVTITSATLDVGDIAAIFSAPN